MRGHENIFYNAFFKILESTHSRSILSTPAAKLFAVPRTNIISDNDDMIRNVNTINV